MEFHPIANVFPLVEGEEFADLVRDISSNGQQQPIYMYEGKILDGRNRYRACMEAGIEPWIEKWAGSNPVEFVASLNLHRRHLSSSQRAMIAERMLGHLEDEGKKRRAATLRQNATDTEKMPERESGESRERAAKLTGTNPRYVSEAKKLRQEAPEQAERVERGEISISAAKKEHEPLPNEDRTPAKEAVSPDIELPSWGLSKEQKAYWDISKHLVGLTRLDPKLVAEQVQNENDAEKRLDHARGILDWFGRYERAVEEKRKEVRPGNLRAIGGGDG